MNTLTLLLRAAGEAWTGAGSFYGQVPSRPTPTLKVGVGTGWYDFLSTNVPPYFSSSGSFLFLERFRRAIHPVDSEIALSLPQPWLHSDFVHKLKFVTSVSVHSLNPCVQAFIPVLILIISQYLTFISIISIRPVWKLLFLALSQFSTMEIVSRSPPSRSPQSSGLKLTTDLRLFRMLGFSIDLGPKKKNKKVH